ncbi:MAG: hypothetical protein JW969_19270 [Spirochaetales bacterium]|nr:hypothetical protein [Spirochaetales bacterium]
MKNETKKDRFKRVGEKRVQNVLKGIRNLSGLSNKNTYEWDPAQLEKIWAAINDELETCKECFKNPDSRKFRL